MTPHAVLVLKVYHSDDRKEGCGIIQILCLVLVFMLQSQSNFKVECSLVEVMSIIWFHLIWLLLCYTGYCHEVAACGS